MIMWQATIWKSKSGVRLSQQLSRVPSSAQLYFWFLFCLHFSLCSHHTHPMRGGTYRNLQTTSYMYYYTILIIFTAGVVSGQALFGLCRRQVNFLNKIKPYFHPGNIFRSKSNLVFHFHYFEQKSRGKK